MRGRRARVWSTAAVAAVALAAAIGCGRGDARKQAIAVHWQEGARYVYTARLTSHAGLGGQSPFDLELATGVELAPVRVSGARAELALTLVAPKLSVGGRAAPESDPTSAALARPFLFTLDGGKVTEERFSPDVPVAAAGLLRTLAAAFQLASPDAKGAAWTAREYDATGGYDAAYSWGAEPGAVSKRKLRYAETLVAGPADAATRARVAAQVAASRGELRVKDGALATIHLGDTITSQVLTKSPLAVETELALDLREIGPARPGAPARDALLAATTALPARQAYGTGASNGMFDRARLDGRTFEQLASALEADARAAAAHEAARKDDHAPADADRAAREGQLRGHVATFSALVALLRVEPETVKKAVAKARGGSPAAGAILDALAAAGTDEAQGALAALVTDAKLDADARIAAANSLIRVQRPGPRTVDTLTQLIPDPLLREHAVFGLGTAARRLREAGDAARSREISERLVALLRAAKQPDDQIRCLRGIANSAYGAALRAVRPFASASDASLRVAAIEATRLMDDPAVDAFITGPMDKDEDAGVRRAAVQVAARRPPSAQLAAALTRVALHDADASTRQHAVELLGRWLAQDAKLRGVLEKVAAKDDRPEIREAAKQALQLQKA